MDARTIYRNSEDQGERGEAADGGGLMPHDEVAEALVFVHDKRRKEWLALRPGDTLTDN
jgi:hypothetical protein